MGKPESVIPSGRFGVWLNSTRNRFGLDKKQLSIRSGVGQSSITQLEGDVRKPSQKMVERLVSGLVSGSSPDIALLVLNEGRIAAGFAPTSPVAEMVALTPEERAIIEQIRAMKAAPPAPAADPHALPPPGYTVGGRLPSVRMPESVQGTGPAPSVEESRKGTR